MMFFLVIFIHVLDNIFCPYVEDKCYNRLLICKIPQCDLQVGNKRWR